MVCNRFPFFTPHLKNRLYLFTSSYTRDIGFISANHTLPVEANKRTWPYPYCVPGEYLRENGEVCWLWHTATTLLHSCHRTRMLSNSLNLRSSLPVCQCFCLADSGKNRPSRIESAFDLVLKNRKRHLFHFAPEPILSWRRINVALKT